MPGEEQRQILYQRVSTVSNESDHKPEAEN